MFYYNMYKSQKFIEIDRSHIPRTLRMHVNEISNKLHLPALVVSSLVSVRLLHDMDMH